MILKKEIYNGNDLFFLNKKGNADPDFLLINKNITLPKEFIGKRIIVSVMVIDESKKREDFYNKYNSFKASLSRLNNIIENSKIIKEIEGGEE